MGTVTFDEEGFRNYMQEKELAPGTIYGYIGHCKKYFESHDLISAKELIEYKEELQKDLKPQSVNNYVNALRAYIRYKGLNISIKGVKLAKRMNVENVIDVKNYHKLIAGLKKDNDLNGYLIVTLLAKTGTRISEAIRITKGDALRGDVEMHTKGKMRRIIIPACIKREFAEYLANIGENDTLIKCSTNKATTIRNIQCRLQRYGKKYGIPREYMHPHAFRHFFAVNFLKNTGNVTLLADLLGHTNINTTMIYTRMSVQQQKDELDNAINW